jgi:enamine deaminase RidA (YjgF/YER057c/UK114 family)
MADVVRLKVWLNDWRDKDACDAAYAAHFAGRKIAVSTIGSWGFPLPFAIVEAELTAQVGGPSDCRHECVAGQDVAQALAKLELEARDVVSVNVTLADVRQLHAMEEAWTAFFKPPYPARTVSVAPLADPSMRVGIEATAVKGGGEPVEPRGLSRVPGAASTAMLAGDRLFISAQAGLEAEGVMNQTRAAWQRINAVLESARMDVTHVVRANNSLTDWRNYKAFNGAYGEFVTPPYPPRATVVAGLAEPAALVQIEVFAHRAGCDATVLQANEEIGR